MHLVDQASCTDLLSLIRFEPKVYWLRFNGVVIPVDGGTRSLLRNQPLQLLTHQVIPLAVHQWTPPLVLEHIASKRYLPLSRLKTPPAKTVLPVHITLVLHQTAHHPHPPVNHLWKLCARGSQPDHHCFCHPAKGASWQPS